MKIGEIRISDPGVLDVRICVQSVLKSSLG